MSKKRPNNIAFFRMLKTGMDQHQFAAAIYRTHSAVCHWETGYAEPQIGDCIRMAKYLGVSLDDLFMNEIDQSTFEEVRNQFLNAHQNHHRSLRYAGPHTHKKKEKKNG